MQACFWRVTPRTWSPGPWFIGQLQGSTSRPLAQRARAPLPTLPHLYRHYTASDNVVQRSRIPRRKRYISTLRPDLLKGEDFVDASGMVSIRVIPKLDVVLQENKLKAVPRWQDVPKGHGADLYYRCTKSPLAGKVNVHLRMPEGTKGFLYYHNPSFAPPHTGQIRFRITGSSDPRSFDSGKDLLAPNGVLPTTWPLGAIVSSPPYQLFIPLLLKDHLVTEEILEQTANLQLGNRSPWSRLLYAFNQPFQFNLQAYEVRLNIMGMENNKLVIENLCLYGPSVNSYRDGSYPFSGSALCCFVRAPDGRIMIQYLKIFDLAVVGDHSRVPVPQEGQYLQTRSGKLWSYEVPKEKRAWDQKWGLRLLKECPGVSWTMF